MSKVTQKIKVIHKEQNRDNLKIEEITKNLDKKFKEELKDRESDEAEENEDFVERAKSEYGIDLDGIKEDTLQKIRKYSLRFEKTLTNSVLETDNPKQVLGLVERLHHMVLEYMNPSYAEQFLTEKINKKVNRLLYDKLDLIKNEKEYLDELISDTNKSVESLRKEKLEMLRKAGRSDRDRSEAFRKYKTVEKSLLNLIEDLEKAEDIHTVDNDMSAYIDVIENEIGKNEKELEMYGEIIPQAEGIQEIASEKYELLLQKMNEQRFIKSEIRKYRQTVNKLEKRIELHINKDGANRYNKPLERVNTARDIITDSVNTVNKLVEASYISNNILTEFPGYDTIETKELTKSSFQNVKYDERLDRDIANRKGVELAKSVREKRKAEIRSTYDLH